ncbi:MAG TPA: GNAT family N-acetyltransferase [Candidatus Coproplasma stercoravium]|nr:GNAT family N-acetyltransferase [Candidatus Coproplasma stercoravium]
MKFTFKRMQQNSAIIIADEWKYEEPYSFYDMTADLDDYNELVNEALRNKNEWFEAHADDELVGYFCLCIENDNIDIGLGLRPDYCGRGMGKQFLTDIICFIERSYAYSTLSMDVAAFNKRAIKVYNSCGFKETHSFLQHTNGGEYDFIHLIMQK